MKLVASAPGKAILMGEHAAVYGRPALVAAVDRRAWAELRLLPGSGGLVLRLPDVGVEERTSSAELYAYAGERARAWRRWAADPGRVDFATVVGSDPAHVVKVAVGEAIAEMARAESDDAGVEVGREGWLEGVLTVRSDLPVGSGFGSSAAVAASVLACVLGSRGDSVDASTVERLGLATERRQHGAPSGVDGMTVVRGGALWVERVEDRLVGHPVASVKSAGAEKSEDFPTPNVSGATILGPISEDLSGERKSQGSGLLGPRWRIFQSGEPTSSTGEVVAAVRQLRARSPRRFDAAMDSACAATAELRAQLGSDQADPAAVIESLRRFQAWLETLGVVPDAVRTRIRRIEALGGAAKISGAGSLGGNGAGSVLVYHPDLEALGAEASTSRTLPSEAPTPATSQPATSQPATSQPAASGRGQADPALFAGWHALDLGLGAVGLRLSRQDGDSPIA